MVVLTISGLARRLGMAAKAEAWLFRITDREVTISRAKIDQTDLPGQCIVLFWCSMEGLDPDDRAAGPALNKNDRCVMLPPCFLLGRPFATVNATERELLPARNSSDIFRHAAHDARDIASSGIGLLLVELYDLGGEVAVVHAGSPISGRAIRHSQRKRIVLACSIWSAVRIVPLVSRPFWTALATAVLSVSAMKRHCVELVGRGPAEPTT